MTETKTERYTETKRETGGLHVLDLMTLFTKKNRRGLACHCRVAYARVALRYWHAFGRVWSDTWIHDSLAKAQPKEAFIMGSRNDDHVLPSRKIALWLALPSGSSVGRAPSLKGAIQVRSTRGYFSYDAGGVTTFSPTEAVGLLT